MELFKLLGTIAIENAEAKKALQETGQEGDKAQSKLSKAFGAIGKGAAVVGKGIAVGLAAGATAMTGLTVKALNLSGDLEQNMGGAEAVFGELGKTIGDMEVPMQRYDAATGKVITETSNLEKVSKEAYANMGLSQSDYLATANKMGALFKGAGFETQEALDLSSQAMQRAADVASIMGLDTSAAMEAVAGAAKGNFTMMDNLGVAMNDTAIQNYALEKGINKTTAEMTQQEKIGLAMEMFLDKTSYAAGNYAKENATLAGSLGTAKAALSNFLAGSGDVESLVSSFSNLANVVIKSLGEIVPRLTTGLTDIVNQVAPMLPGLLNQLLPILIQGATSLVNGLVAALPGVLSALMAALPALIDGVMSIVDGLIGALPQIMTAIVSALPTLIPQLIDAAVNLIMMLVTMLPQIIQPIIDALPTIIVSIVDVLISNLPVLIQGCVQLIVALAAALPQIVSALWSAIQGIFVLLGSKILGFFEPVKTAISNAWQAMGNVPGLSSLKTTIEQVWAAIMSHIKTVLDAIKNVVSTAWNAIKNVVSTVLNAVKNVISTAWNAIKTIISNVMKLISSVLKGDWEGVKSAISNILNAIKSVISSVWNGIKSVISSVLNGIKSVVSSVWNGIKSVISSTLNTIRSVVTSVWNGIKGAISGAVNGVKTTVTTGFNNVKNTIVNTLKSIPGKVASIGMDIVRGIGRGITNGIGYIKGVIKSFVGNVTSFLKSMFKIASPSKLMRDEVGRFIAEGVAVGIEENTDTVEDASEEMGKKVLEAAQKRLDNYKVYNQLSLADEVGFWDEIRKQCAEGTQARIDADKKYLDAKSQLDEKIIAAEDKLIEARKTLNQEIKAADDELIASLDSINSEVDKYAESFEDAFGLFKMPSVDKPISDVDMFYSMGAQVDALEQYKEEITKLQERIGDTALFEEIEAMGIKALPQIATLNNMSDYALDYYMNMYKQREALSKDIAGGLMADDVETKTAEALQKRNDAVAAANQKFKGETEAYFTELEGLGVEVIDKTKVATTAAVNELQSMLQKFQAAIESFSPKMKLPHFKIEGSLDLESGSVPSVSVEWFKKAMNNAMVLNNPTIFGYNNGRFLGAGDAGSEVVAGSSTLMKMIQGAVATQNSALISYLQKIVEMLATFFPEQIGTFRNMKLQLNTGALVGELVVPMDQALGKLSTRKDRGR